jgi:hypothetical protein
MDVGVLFVFVDPVQDHPSQRIIPFRVVERLGVTWEKFQISYDVCPARIDNVSRPANRQRGPSATQ